jgi:hypothetical protein
VKSIIDGASSCGIPALVPDCCEAEGPVTGTVYNRMVLGSATKMRKVGPPS